jgi:hypothetical protein
VVLQVLPVLYRVTASYTAVLTLLTLCPVQVLLVQLTLEPLSE